MLETLFSEFHELVKSGFVPVTPGSRVTQTARTFDVPGFGAFRIRHYEGYEGVNSADGTRVFVPAALQAHFRADLELTAALKDKITLISPPELNVRELERELNSVRNRILAGATSCEVPGTGVFEVSCQEKPSGLMWFVRFSPSPDLNSRLQELLSGFYVLNPDGAR